MKPFMSCHSEFSPAQTGSVSHQSRLAPSMIKRASTRWFPCLTVRAWQLYFASAAIMQTSCMPSAIHHHAIQRTDLTAASVQGARAVHAMCCATKVTLQTGLGPSCAGATPDAMICAIWMLGDT